MKNAAIILSGCGVYDGSEIHEAIMVMLAIDKSGGKYSIFAPNRDQFHAINHLNGDVMSENRNILVESARIARGKIAPINTLNPDDFDLIVFPGGYGVAKNISNYANAGVEMNVDKDIEEVIKKFHAQNKPIGAMCIAPVLLAKIIPNALLTIGNDQLASDHLSQLGATHKRCDQTEVLIDYKNRIVSTPCYMLNASISQIAQSAENLISALYNL